MHKVFHVVLALIALTVHAFAGDEVMASRYGNTTVITMANGSVVKIWYNADHTWTGEAGGAAIAGTWKVDGNQLCVSWNNPPPNMTNPTCSMAAERKIGENWTVGEGDAKMSVTLAAGKQ